MVKGPGERLDAVPLQRTGVDVFDLAVGDVATRATPKACGLAEAEKRRGAVTSTNVAGWIDERLYQENRMTPRLHPVRTQPFQCPAHHRRRGVLATTGWQHAESLVRCDEATKRSLRIWISWDQPMNRSRDPHESAGDANPTNATHSPDESTAT